MHTVYPLIPKNYDLYRNPITNSVLLSKHVGGQVGSKPSMRTMAEADIKRIWYKE